MIIAEREIADKATFGSEVGWQTLQRLKSLGPSPPTTPGLRRARRKMKMRRVKRTDSETSQRPFLIRHSVSVEDNLQDIPLGNGKMPAHNGLQIFEMEKPPKGTLTCLIPSAQSLSTAGWPCKHILRMTGHFDDLI